MTGRQQLLQFAGPVPVDLFLQQRLRPRQVGYRGEAVVTLDIVDPRLVEVLGQVYDASFLLEQRPA